MASRRGALWIKANATRTDPGVYACPPADGEAGSIPPGQRAAFGHAKVTINRSPMPTASASHLATAPVRSTGGSSPRQTAPGQLAGAPDGQLILMLRPSPFLDTWT